MMNKHNVTTVEYNKLYEFVLNSESQQDYIERLQILSTVIINELANRITERKVYFPMQLVPIIDEMNEEIIALVDNINKTNSIKGSPQVMPTLLLRLIKLNNIRIFNDYVYGKIVMLN